MAHANGQVNGQLNGHVEGVGEIRAVNINHEMQTAYLDYAMSVIVARALPDVRDGLKPVHRRILYSMYHDLGLTADKPHKKSARIVGEVLGKYHPHGDTAVYDAMVRMAQEFSLRYPLVDGQGNFGSIDGDNAAAMRYTEARLARIANLMLDDLDKDTVDWQDNFDNSLREPQVLPAALPNLLINGSNGIAVGMATNIPPHNLSEVVDALAYVIDHFDKVDEITVEELMRFIKGPDFPTGGILYRFREDSKGDENTDAIAQGYAVGKSRLILQAKAHFEEMSRNRSRIVVTELPYQTNKTALLERIATLARDGKLEGITDLRDESDRTGMRIVVEMTRTVEPKQMLERLFKYTPLQQTFGMQMLALVEGEPRTLGLKRVLQLFVNHRQEVIRRRSEYELAKAKARAHIVEGLLRALDILDEVIATIRSSRTVETARNNLVKNFQFTEIQAQAILDMQLRRLAALERKKLQDEYKELQTLIAHLEDLLANPHKILALIKEDLLKIKEEYGDARRTQIVERTKGTLTSTDLLPEQDVWVAVSRDGDLRRQDVSSASKTTARQMGKKADLTLITANTRDFLYLFGKDGQCRRLSIHEIPQDGSSRHAADYTEFTRRDAITAAVALSRDLADGAGYLFMATAQGMVKRVTLADFANVAHADPVVMNVDARDRLGWVLQTNGNQDVILVTKNGQSIRFNEEDVRSMGLAAGGVGGMKLKKNDEIVYASVVEPTGELLTMTEQGYTKRSSLEEYSTQGRNGGGIVTHKPTSRTGPVVAALMLPGRALVQAADEWLTVTLSKGTPTALTIDEIPQMGRGVQGKQVVAAGMGIAVENITHLQMPEETHAPNGGAPEDEPELGRNGAASKKTETAVRTTAQARAKRKSAALKSATSKSAKPKGGVAARKTTTAAKASSSAAASQSPRAAKHNKNKSSDKATTNQSTTNQSTTSKSTQNKSASNRSRADRSIANKSTANKSTAKAKQPAAKAVATKKTAAQSTATASSSQAAASSGAAKQKSVTTKTTGSKRKTVDSTAQPTPRPTRKKATTPKATAQSKANSSSSKKTKAVEKKATTSRKSTVATKAAPAQTSQSATPKTGNTKTASAKTSNPKASSAKASRPKTDDTQLDGGRKKAKSTGARKTSATKTAHSAAAAKGNATSATAKGNKNSAAKSTAPSTPSTKSKAAATPKAAATKRRAGKAPKVAVVASVTKSQANQAKDSAQKR
ncbi:MAG: DNA gyrase subunit A [Caldilineaceae bacterium]|nr:DNA gyrase subunit A [Caldilineaceae bacterium]